MESNPRDRAGALPDVVEDDRGLPAPVAEMSAAMHEAIERARFYAARWIDQRDRMTRAVDAYRSTRTYPTPDLREDGVPGVGDA